MSVLPRFNYIITIHNKEDMIEQVIMSVLMCCRDNSHIYPVIDGCTDRTEEIIDKIVETYAHVPITKVRTGDVHELLSINAGLKAADQDEDGYNVILQDDVILADYLLEKKVAALYQWAGPRLGYVSFRLGANFIKDAATSDASVPYCDYVENAYGHGIHEADVLLPGYLAYRSVPIKSPVCIPSSLVRSLGMFDERLAPYGHDDLEYSIRLLKAGYRNGVFALRFFSDVKWGGTRTTPHPELNKIIQRNMKLIREWRAGDIEDICRSAQGKEVVKVPGMSNDDDAQAGMEAWAKNREDLISFQRGNWSGIPAHVKSSVRKALSANKLSRSILKNLLPQG